MPTGYTDDISKGIAFDQFVWSCARAFGALVMMRDDPHGAQIPERFEPSDHYRAELAEARAESERVAGMTDAQADDAAAAEYAKSEEHHLTRISEMRALRAKYLAMRAKAEEWTPPSADHEGLKRFMIEQIDSSISADCCERYIDAPKLMTGSAWRAAKLADLDQDIKYHHDENAKEVARAESRNAWLAALRASVPYPVRRENQPVPARRRENA